MDSLRVAADKLKKSPKAMKKKIDEALNKDKHSDDWINNRENVQNGVTFNVKVLGKRPATHPQGKGCTDETVEELVQKYKNKGKHEKLQKVSMRVDSKKMIIRDLLTHELIDDVQVHRISYCTADPHYPKVFALIAREKLTKKLYTHAFLTNRKAMAEAIALTVAQAFTMAYEEWEEKSKERQEQVENAQDADAKDLYGDLGEEKPSSKSTNPFKAFEEDDGEFGYVSNMLAPKVEAIEIVEPCSNDSPDEEQDEFQMLAKSRRKGLDTGLVRKATFKGNITDFLAVNNTLTDLERARSTEDLSASPWSSPAPSPPTERPFEFRTNVPPSPTPATSENLIEF
ncbi:low density lipoprotein receptor adapter protein 1-like isoform X2 [Hydractinia symbiolongicarpus]|nr:low density lipoprotein receptor adapter protein 1-like isoform X2 [Hydractinia symbiolongicarpus]XP_057306453.1 low density lipoprotein receptor adapter protein 1-like isoform X2 [Hydractinia symbiolongicarpus]XP_057306454.1 low density lipoprotein receptor adapter protein 1-like isoform X2 [Hydractinia symbiolongicarpus]